jgi:hypothetical protein
LRSENPLPSCASQQNSLPRVRFTPESGHPHAEAATLFLFSPDDHCPIDSAAILRMCDVDPLRPVQQQIGAMHAVTDENPAILISAFRHHHGEESVAISPVLTRIAQEQANAMAARDSLDQY